MSFRLKTILGIAMIELTVMVILIGINQFALGGSATTQLKERADATARVFANAVSDAVIATDLATLDATVATAIGTEDLTYLRVVSPTGFVLTQAGDAAALAEEFEQDMSFETAKSDHRLDVSVPVTVEGTTFGRIEMGVSTLSVEQEIANAFRLNVVVALVGMSLVAVFGFGLGTILTRQLGSLRMGARAIAQGHLGHEIKVRGRDELAETALCFNEMARTLREDRRALQDQKDELLAKKSRVEVIVDCMKSISHGGDLAHVPDTERGDEIGDMARATVVFQNSMQANEQARIEQQRLITAFDQVAEQVVVFGTDGRAMFQNKAFQRFNAAILAELDEGFTYRDFLMAGCRIGAFTKTGEDVDGWVQTQLEQGHMDPHEMTRAPDRILLVVQSCVEGIGLVVSAKDVTELRQSERQLVQASKMATLGEMATGIAHEINQPLGVIRMAAANSVKRIDRDKADFAQLKSKFERISEQTERAAQIIDQMRFFGRKADGKTGPIDLAASLKEVAYLARTQLHTLDISLRLDVPDETHFVIGEKVLFEQVLLNLISNARDAIEETGTTKGEIFLQAAFDTEQGHVITLRDTGGGIPEHVLDKLFEPFFTTKDPNKGTGLGLSISFGTIRDMSGQISAVNCEGGACFTITLPNATPEMAQAS